MRLLPRCSLAASLVLVMTAPAPADPGKEAGRKPAPFAAKVVGSGPPIVFVPGLACSGAVWDTTVDHFKGKHECHVLTLAGFAGQPPVEGPFLETMGKAIAEYIREKKLKKPALVGHSLGGFLVLSLGASEPGLTGPIIAVDGLPCGPALIKPDLTAEELKQGALIGTALKAATREVFLQQQRALLRMWITDPKLLDLAAGWGAASDQATVARAMGELWSRDLRAEVAKIQSPVLLVAAAPGSFTGVPEGEMKKRYRSQVEKVPDAKVVFASKAQHFIMFDEPEWLNRQIEAFLTAKSAKGK